MLLDYFHPPLAGARKWTSVLIGWASRLAAQLNEILPEGVVR